LLFWRFQGYRSLASRSDRPCRLGLTAILSIGLTDLSDQEDWVVWNDWEFYQTFAVGEPIRIGSWIDRLPAPKLDDNSWDWIPKLTGN
ncbi:MAG TPA: hypothetical protein VIY86_04150, partial [Pirellulaceae bacterium]